LRNAFDKLVNKHSALENMLSQHLNDVQRNEVKLFFYYLKFISILIEKALAYKLIRKSEIVFPTSRLGKIKVKYIILISILLEQSWLHWRR